ncbi:MAG: BolA/IbaG family iron-sulfur metabolism protein [Caulobacteraceae bacterium]
MAISIEELEQSLRAAFPDASIEVEDLAGDGDHYRARIVAETFRGVPRVRQHQMVYAALGGRMGGDLHALALTTAAPSATGEN